MQSLPSSVHFPSSDSLLLLSLSAVFSSYDNWEFPSKPWCNVDWNLIVIQIDSHFHSDAKDSAGSAEGTYCTGETISKSNNNCHLFRRSSRPSSLTSHSEWYFSFHSWDSIWLECMGISWLCLVLSSLLSTLLSCYTSWEGSLRNKRTRNRQWELYRLACGSSEISSDIVTAIILIFFPVIVLESHTSGEYWPTPISLMFNSSTVRVLWVLHPFLNQEEPIEEKTLSPLFW